MALRILEMAQRPALLGVKLDLGPNLERVVPSNFNTLVAQTTSWVVARIKGKPPETIRIVSPGGERTVLLNPAKIADDGDLRLRWAQGRLQLCKWRRDVFRS